MKKPVAVSIAGSDPSAGAGIQADLRMFSALGVYGTTVVTALTAQNPDRVTGVLGVEAGFVRAQINALFEALRFEELYLRYKLECESWLSRADQERLAILETRV